MTTAEAPERQEELDLRSYLRPVWRRKWMVLVIVVVATVGTYLVSSHQAKTYNASTNLYVEAADPTLSLSQLGTLSISVPSSQQLADVAQLMTGQSVTDRVSRDIGMPASSAGSVTATPSPNSDFVTVATTSHNPVMAAKLANAYVSAFLASRQHTVTSQALQALRGARSTLSAIPNTAANSVQREAIQQQISNYKQIAADPNAGARQIDAAVAPHFPTSPKPVRDAIFGAAIGLALAVIVAFCLELLDRKLVRVSAVESIYGRHVLAVLPHVGEPSPANEHGASVPPPFLEELRTLRVMLRLSAEPSPPPRTIIITSALPRDGKTTVTRALALVYAESGERVLLIDGDLRRPSIESLFGIEAEAGLAQILRGEASLSSVVARVRAPSHLSVNGNGAGPTGDPSTRGSIDILAYGDKVDNPLALISSPRMEELLREAAASYDVVLIDTAPVLAVADSMPLLKLGESVLLVARLGQTTRGVANRFTEIIERLSDVNFAGVVANDRRERWDDDGYGSYGRYGYGYYYGSQNGGQKDKAAATAS